jgi:thymidylate synthase (FAD)
MMKKIDPLGDGISSVELLPIAPSDLQVVNAARVSMGKISTNFSEKDEGLINYLAEHNHWTPFSHVQFLVERKMPIEVYIHWCGISTDEQFVRSIISMRNGSHRGVGYDVHFYERGSLYAFLKHSIITEEMKKTVPYSIRAFMLAFEIIPQPDKYFIADWTHMLSQPEDEWWNKIKIYEFENDRAPFYGSGWNVAKLQVAQFRIRMPIFVARQWYKHQIGFTRNEVSRRYVSDAPEFFIPNEWRLQADNVKQGSSEELHEYSEDMQGWVANATYEMQSKYNELIDDENICPEQSRTILPQSMYTEFVETASIDAYNRLINLRSDDNAQKEIQKYAKSIKKCLTKGVK